MRPCIIHIMCIYSHMASKIWMIDEKRVKKRLQYIQTRTIFILKKEKKYKQRTHYISTITITVVIWFSPVVISHVIQTKFSAAYIYKVFSFHCCLPDYQHLLPPLFSLSFFSLLPLFVRILIDLFEQTTFKVSRINFDDDACWYYERDGKKASVKN